MGNHRAQRPMPAKRRGPARRVSARGTRLIIIGTGVVLTAVTVTLASSATARRLVTGGRRIATTAMPGSGKSNGPATAAQSRAEAGLARARSLAGKLSITQLAGQRVIYSYSGRKPPAELLRLIRHGEVAGVIFFSDNIGTTSADLANFRDVVRELRRANASTSNPVRLPLLLMTDQEGGEVRRLPGVPDFSQKQIGASAHPWRRASKAGANAARNLRSYGLNVNLAPVLGVYRTRGDFLDYYGRSYSSRSAQAAKLGSLFITAQQNGGVAATAKHFPGLGAATHAENTDERPVTLHVPLSQLHAIDERPFKAAIGAKVKLVMVSWAIYPALDRKYPAGLSSRIVEGQLRHRLGFRGVTITDALGAGALKPFGKTAHRATMAARAGMDLLLCSGGSYQEGVAAMNALRYDYQHGRLAKSTFKSAAVRVLALRASLSG